jgi:superfamily II DNA or RNA helicase
LDLWPTQERTITRLSNVLKQGKMRPVVVSPTGSGKTRVAAHIIHQIEAADKSVLFLAPRRELIYQTVEQLKAYGIEPGVIMAGEPTNPYRKVQVASFDTLHARGFRANKMVIPHADFVLVDEAHLSITEKRLAMLNHFSDARVIGLTATPARGDGTGLGEFYDEIVNETSVRELVELGILVDAEYYAPSEWDLTGVKATKSDYVVKYLEKAVDKSELIGDIYDNWKRIASDKRTVIFCTTRKHARHVCEVFVSNGVACEYVDGETPLEERQAIFDRVRSGETQVLCNVFVASYGLDIPPLECCVLARPTKNLTLYIQIVGRVLRACGSKRTATIIDHTGAVKRHGFVDYEFPWSLDGGDVRDATQKQKQDKKEPREIHCEKCGKVFSGQRECPACGHEIVPKGQAMPFHEAELRKVNKNKKDYSDIEKISWMGQLITYGQTKGYQSGWAAHQFNTKFGHFPPWKSVPPEPMSSEVLGWIKSRQIAYHIGRQKRQRLLKQRIA